MRVHRSPSAARAAHDVQARAFAVGTHIYLGAAERLDDPVLLAHEVTHVVQQSLSAPVKARGPPGSPTDTLMLTPAPRGLIQREAGSWVPDFVQEAAAGVQDLAAEGFWAVIDRVAPRELARLLYDIRDHGFRAVLKTRISGALRGVMAGLKAEGGTPAALAAGFESLLARTRPVAAALAAADCQPLFAAVRELGDVLGQLAGEAWDRLTTFLQPIGDWLSDAWQRFGAPVVDFLRQYAADTWEGIQRLGDQLWSLSRPVRELYSGAWAGIQRLLGFSGDDSDSGGLGGWIRQKAENVWTELQQELQPVVGPLRQAAEAVVDFLPLTQVLRARESIGTWVERATAMADRMDEPDDVAANQELLRDAVLPAVRRTLGELRGELGAAAGWAQSALGNLGSRVSSLLTRWAEHPLLGAFAGALTRLEAEARSLAAWATERVSGVFAQANEALILLDRWLEPVLAALQKLSAAVLDLTGRLGDFVLGPWRLLPACLRTPLQDFVVTRILSQLPVFSQLVALPALWEKVQPAFRSVVVRVFRDGDLFGAAWSFFRTALSLLGVPPDLVTRLLRNAARAVQDIVRDPVGFLGNVLAAMKAGLLQFVDRFGKHLLDGAVAWLLSGVRQAGVRIPDPFAFTLRNVLDLVLQVLDVTREKIFQRIEKQQGAEVAKKVRRMVAAGEKVFAWLSILITEGPAGLWQHLKEELGNLWTRLLDTVIDFLIGRIVQQATLWVTKTLASGGLGVILDAIKAVYDALQVMAEYLRELLEVANAVCEGVSDVAKGVLGPAADLVERTAARLIVPVLAFLARTLGVGDLPAVIGQGIQKLRTMVERAIDRLIERAFAALDWVKQKARDAVDAVLEWWRQREVFTNADGESHTLRFQGDAAAAVLMVESTPRPLESFLAGYEATRSPDAAEKEIIRQIRTKVTAIENTKSRHGTRDRSSFTAADGEAIRQLFLAIVGLLARLRGDGAPPPTQVTWSAPDEDGAYMTAEPLSLHPGSFAGSKPREQSALWKRVSARYPGQYVRGHLLNHHVHGPGTRQNLTPITIGANNEMERVAESVVKQAVLNEKRVLRFVVSVTAYHPSRPGFPEAARLPRQLTLRADEIARRQGAWQTKSTVLPTRTVDSPLPT